MSHSTTCLITGAQGVLARPLVAALKDTLPLKLTDIRDEPIEGLPCTACDLTNLDETLEVFEGVDTVVHLAIASCRNYGAPGECDLPEAQRSQEWLDAYSKALLAINPSSTYNVFEAARRRGVRRVVYISSLTVYLGKRDLSPRTNETPLEPVNLYACTKLFGEHVARLYWHTHGVEAITLRIGQPYPVGGYLDEGFKNPLSRALLVYKPDFVESVRCALQTPVSFGVYNIVSTSDCQVFDLSPAAEIGYHPAGHFTESGLTIRHSES